MKRESRKKEQRKRKKNNRHYIHGHLLHVKYMEAVPKRLSLVSRHLRMLKETFETLFSDENFVTLLKAEGLGTLPTYLAERIQLSEKG